MISRKGQIIYREYTGADDDAKADLKLIREITRGKMVSYVYTPHILIFKGDVDRYTVCWEDAITIARKKR